MDKEKHLILKEKIISAYKPSVLTISTNSAFEIAKLNNLTPAELLRPFGEVTDAEIKLEDQNTIRLKKFSFHFVDTDHLQSKKPDECIDGLKKILHYYSPSFPFPDVQTMTLNSCLEMKDRAVWINKFVKGFKELSSFAYGEYLSTPLSVLYILTTKDNIIEEMKQIDNLSYIKALKSEKLLLSDHQFYLLLNDGKGEDVSSQLAKLRMRTNTLRVHSVTVNTNIGKPLPDIWEPFIEESDIIKRGTQFHGQMISNVDRKEIHEVLAGVFKNDILGYVERTIMDKRKKTEKNLSFWVA